MGEKLVASGIILAGGRSSRIGQDKGRLELGGTELAQRSVNYLEKIFTEIIFVTNQPQIVPWSEKLVVVEDEVPYQGPLGGILAGLQASDHLYNFVVGIDMPFLNDALIKFLLDQVSQADVVVPRLKNGFEPLYAAYSKNCLPVIRNYLKKSDFRMISFFKDVKVKEVSEDELRRYDPELLSFFNINTWDDYRAAQQIYEQMERDGAN